MAPFLSTAVVLSGPVSGPDPAAKMMASMLSTALSTFPSKFADWMPAEFFYRLSLFLFPGHPVYGRLQFFDNSPMICFPFVPLAPAIKIFLDAFPFHGSFYSLSIE